jgi:hypothetical protein
MAREVQIRLIDDLDGEVAEETVTFGLDGVTYEIDLSAKNAAALRESLAKYVAVGRRAAGSRRPVARNVGQDRDRNNQIREWARANGHRVSDRGRISATIVEAYESANS